MHKVKKKLRSVGSLSDSKCDSSLCISLPTNPSTSPCDNFCSRLRPPSSKPLEPCFQPTDRAADCPLQQTNSFYLVVAGLLLLLLSGRETQERMRLSTLTATHDLKEPAWGQPYISATFVKCKKQMGNRWTNEQNFHTLFSSVLCTFRLNYLFTQLQIKTCNLHLC